MTGTQLTTYNEEWAKQAQSYAEQEQMAGGTFLSTRGGTLSFGEETLPGNQACVIILDAVKENTFYANEFDPDQRAAPTCYAFGRGLEELAPHPSMQTAPEYFVPQSMECKTCPWNEWGSADKGRGKACQNRRRLALVPAGYYQAKHRSRDFDLHLFDDPKHFQQAEVAFIKLPVLSVKNWSKYVTQLDAQLHRPPHGVITRIYLEPDPKSQYKVNFELIEEVPDSLFNVIMARHEEATKAVIQGYQPPQEDDKAQQAAQTGSLRGLRRGR